MATIEDVARLAVAAVDLNVSFLFVCDFVKQRYTELVSRTKLKQLRTEINVFVPAPYTTGTLAVTQGSATAVGTGTAFGPQHVGWQVRVQYNWYTVVEVSGQTLTLEAPYADDTNAAGGFILLQRFIPLDPSVRWVSGIRHPRRFRSLLQRSLEWIDVRFARRLMVGPFPRYWCEAARNVGLSALAANRGKLLQIYPPSNIPETYVVLAWVVPEDLGPKSELPPEVDSYILREGAIVDIYRMKANEAAAAVPPNRELAELYSNLEARQRTIWENHIARAIAADRGSDDGEIETYHADGEDYLDDGDIVTARDLIYSQWSR